MRASTVWYLRCSQSLNAVTAAVYLSLVGYDGLKTAAKQSVDKAHYLCDGICAVKGFKKKFNAPFFNEFAVECPEPPEKLNGRLLGKKILGGLPLARLYPGMDNVMLVAATEKRTKAEMDAFIGTLKGL